MSKNPYWRWWRYRRRRIANRKGAVAKPWNGLIRVAAIVGLLVVFDQLVKTILVTPDWAWHEQPSTWLLNPTIFILSLLPFLLFRVTQLAASFGIAAAIGNGLSALGGGAVANPFVMQHGEDFIAFNVADAYLMVGLALSIIAALTVLVRHRPRRQSA